MSNLILYGLPKVGKSYFAKQLSLETNTPYVDTDRLVEEYFFTIYKKKYSVKNIANTYGLCLFRQIETRVISVLPFISHHIISLGGGSLLSSKNRELISNLGTLIYLTQPKNLWEKNFIDNNSPYLKQIFSNSKIYENRIRIYEKMNYIEKVFTNTGQKETLKKLKDILWQVIL